MLFASTLPGGPGDSTGGRVTVDRLYAMACSLSTTVPDAWIQRGISRGTTPLADDKPRGRICCCSG
jgi:hypothetical protein